MRQWRSASEEETRSVGRRLAKELLPTGVLLLEGELAAGKTVLVQGVAEGLGIARGRIQSPTYTIVHEHPGESGLLVHVDLYRLDAEEILAAGLEEVLAPDGEPRLVAVEWADRLPFEVDRGMRVRLVVEGPGRRRIDELETDRGTSGDAGSV